MRLVLCLSLGALVTCATARKSAIFTAECIQPWEPAGQTLPDGQALFLHEWSQSDARSAMGDGLGPLFNGRSCIECHFQGGVGGAGGQQANVEMVPKVGVVHKHTTHAGWDAHRETLIVGIRLISGGCRLCIEQAKLESSKRATPALFGAGLLDRVTEEDLLVAESLSGRHHPRVRGRIPRDSEGRVGRFGWKGQTPDLATFVEGACANELGLQTPTEAQPQDPRHRSKVEAGVDLERADVEALANYVADLPAPRFVPNEAALRGKVAFVEVGCTACHVETIGEARGAYSDLLLHHMGRPLADPLVSTYGGFQQVTQGTARRDEWRTPPLWGVADSGPWLHDGRAESLEGAIELHGGEALLIRQAYQALPEEDRADVVAFLESLVAPTGAAPMVVASRFEP